MYADEVIVAGPSNDIGARRVVDALVGKSALRWVEISEPGHRPPFIGGLAEATGDIENGSFFEEGYHPSHLHNGMDCFGGGRWDGYLGVLA